MKKVTLIIVLLSAGLTFAQNYNYSIKNINENTENADFGVTFYGENTLVFASSRKDKSISKRVWDFNKQPFLELYKGDLNQDGEISNVGSFSKNINTSPIIWTCFIMLVRSRKTISVKIILNIRYFDEIFKWVDLFWHK